MTLPMPSPTAQLTRTPDGNAKVTDAIPRGALPSLLRTSAEAILAGLLETPARVYVKVVDGLTAAFEADEANNTNAKRMADVLRGFATGIDEKTIRPVEFGLVLACGCCMIVGAKAEEAVRS